MHIPLHCLFILSSADFFQNQLFQKIISDINTIRVSNCLNLDQD